MRCGGFEVAAFWTWLLIRSVPWSATNLKAVARTPPAFPAGIARAYAAIPARGGPSRGEGTSPPDVFLKELKLGWPAYDAAREDEGHMASGRAERVGQRLVGVPVGDD